MDCNFKRRHWYVPKLEVPPTPEASEYGDEEEMD